MGIEKTVKVKNKAPPDSEGWKKAVERGELDQYYIQDVVRAAREFNNIGDRKTLVPLMGHISDQILNVLRSYVGTNHHNEGKDIIHDAHSKLIHAVLVPDSKDGQGLCKAFVPRIRFRALDAIKKDAKIRRRNPSSDDVPDEITKDNSHKPFDQFEKSIYVDQILNLIPDHRKRLAFRLYMDGWQYESSTEAESISEAVGKTPRRVRDWIKETQALLQAKIGEDHE